MGMDGNVKTMDIVSVSIIVFVRPTTQGNTVRQLANAAFPANMDGVLINRMFVNANPIGDLLETAAFTKDPASIVPLLVELARKVPIRAIANQVTWVHSVQLKSVMVVNMVGVTCPRMENHAHVTMLGIMNTTFPALIQRTVLAQRSDIVRFPVSMVAVQPILTLASACTLMLVLSVTQFGVQSAVRHKRAIAATRTTFGVA